MKYKQGDLVQLLSGGPAMTVAALPKAKPAWCVCCYWFDDSKVLHERWFPVDTLQRVVREAA